MGQLRSSSPFFQPGPPAPVGNPDAEILRFLQERAEGKILDMGGGLGAYAHALTSLGREVTLAELNEACLKSARSLSLRTLDMNTTAWNELEKKFDTVMLVDVLEHVENPRIFLQNVVSCAREKVLLTVPCNDDFKKLFDLCLTYGHVAVSDHIQQFTSRDIADLLGSLGCEFTIVPGSHLFPDPILSLLYNEMWKSLRGKIALSSVRIFQKRGWLPRLFPSRIFVEARLRPAMRLQAEADDGRWGENPRPESRE